LTELTIACRSLAQLRDTAIPVNLISIWRRRL
jgi:hypothetical protein